MTSRELLIVAGRIRTFAFAPTESSPEAILLRDGRIAGTGSAKELRTLAGAAVETIEFPHATVLPGVHDSHLHLASWGSLQPPLALDLSPRTVASIADVQAAVAAAAANKHADEWIRGSGWHLGSLAECANGARRPSRFDLDAVAPDHPVALSDFSQHALWVNSRALELAGVSAATETPVGGDIPRDEHGEPIGILSEFAAQSLVARHMPELTRSERRTAIRQAIGQLHRLGITSVTEPALGPGGGVGILGIETLHAYEELCREGQLMLRVGVLMLYGAEGSAAAADIAGGLSYASVESADERWLQELGVKIFADGIPPLRTAWLSEPYAGDSHCGSLVIPGEDPDDRVAELREMVSLAHAAGRQVAVHATGDRTIDATVGAFIAAQHRHPRADPRHYVIHGDLTSRETLRTMALHRIGLNVQPQIKAGAAELMAELLGTSRAAYQWPNRSALDEGVPLAFSSDAPVCWPDWREGVAAAALRESQATGAVSGPEQRITVHEALHAYTAGGARQDFAEDYRGMIAPGYVADLCVLSSDPCDTDPHEIPQIDVLATVVDGHLVHAK